MATVQVRVIATYEAEVEADYGDTEAQLRARAEKMIGDRLAYPDTVVSVVLRTPVLEAALLAQQSGIPHEDALKAVSAPAEEG